MISIKNKEEVIQSTVLSKKGWDKSDNMSKIHQNLCSVGYLMCLMVLQK